VRRPHTHSRSTREGERDNSCSLWGNLQADCRAKKRLMRPSTTNPTLCTAAARSLPALSLHALGLFLPIFLRVMTLIRWEQRKQVQMRCRRHFFFTSATTCQIWCLLWCGGGWVSCVLLARLLCAVTKNNLCCEILYRMNNYSISACFVGHPMLPLTVNIFLATPPHKKPSL
jgi:hypothetical protein